MMIAQMQSTAQVRRQLCSFRVLMTTGATTGDLAISAENTGTVCVVAAAVACRSNHTRRVAEWESAITAAGCRLQPLAAGWA